jgi:ATP-dependent Clp protease adaptor protein ClpS
MNMLETRQPRTMAFEGQLPACQPARSGQGPPYHVVLLDDNDHSYEYVIEMLTSLFGYSVQDAYLMAVEVDLTGRVIVFTAPLEDAERERDRIHAFGADPRIPRSRGPMAAILEPA